MSREPLPDGDFRGHLPEREIMTGIGPVAVRAPRVRDRTGLGADRIRFSSALLPPQHFDFGHAGLGWVRLTEHAAA